MIHIVVQDCYVSSMFHSSNIVSGLAVSLSFNDKQATSYDSWGKIILGAYNYLITFIATYIP